jgi:hypothetical protein
MEPSKYVDRRRLIGFMVVTAVLLPFLFSAARAAWPDDPETNLPICVWTQFQTFPDATTDGSNGVIVVWQDSRNLGYDIYAQRIGADGSYMWTANGTPICTADGEQEFPLVVPDGLGGAIIVWEDRRLTTQNVYAQRVDADGVLQWDANGILVCDGPEYENQLQMIPDGFGGAIVSWTDGRNGLPDIYAQRISASGDTLWTFDGAEVCTDKEDQVESRLATDGSGGAIVCWVDGRDLYSKLYIQRIGASGTPSWTVDGVALTDTSVSQDEQRLVPDGLGGVVITWADQRSGSIDIYAQRVVNAIRIWGSNGLPVCSLSTGTDTPRAVSDGSGGVIVAWYDYRSGDANIYAQHVSGGGTVEWGVDGMPVCTDPGEQIFVQMASDMVGGAIIAWDDYRIPDSRPDIYASRVDGSGTVYWEVDGVAISTAAGQQSEPILVPDDMGGAILAWRDRRNDSGDIYAQHVGSNGQLGDLVAVTITRFDAKPVRGTVELTWDVFTDEAIAGFALYRRKAGEDDRRIAAVASGRQSYVDRAVTVGETYSYSLAAIRLDGAEVRSLPVDVSVPTGELVLGPVVPNPFNPAAMISFVLPGPGHTALAIYDVEGRLVRTLVDGPLPEGRNEIRWDGTDDRGDRVSSGVYFCRLTFGKRSLTQKMIVLK